MPVPYGAMRWADRLGRQHKRAVSRWLRGSGRKRPTGKPLDPKESREVYRRVRGGLPGHWEVRSFSGGDYCYSKEEGGYEINLYVNATGEKYNAWEIGDIDFVRLDTGEVIHSYVPEERHDVQAVQAEAWGHLRECLALLKERS